jgi:hypothetical protein
MSINFSQNTRAYIYRVAVAVMPLLILYGVISEQAAALWVGVLAAVLSVGSSSLAAKNTPTGRSSDV